MGREAVFLRVVWRLLWVAMTAGAVLDFGLDVLAQHWELPFAVPFSEFRPTAWVALVYVVGTLPLFVFMLPPMAIDYFAARAKAKVEVEA